MRLTLLFPILCALLLFGCDPKSNQRQARYDANDCPTCITGACVDCKETGKCTHCDGKGTRTTSTKNYTGEGIKLVDYQESCPFCKGTGTCSYCEGSGKCGTCKGTSKSTEWEPKSVSESNKPAVEPAKTEVPVIDSTATATVPSDSTTKTTESTK